MSYKAIYESAKLNPEKFWMEAANQVDWIKPPSKALFDNNSPFYEEILGQRSISNNSEEEAVTTSVKHNMLINYPSQYFLKEGPLAILPYNKNNFSLVSIFF